MRPPVLAELSPSKTATLLKGLRSEWGYGTLVFLILFFLALLAVPKGAHSESASNTGRTVNLVFADDVNGRIQSSH